MRAPDTTKDITGSGRIWNEMDSSGKAKMVISIYYATQAFCSDANRIICDMRTG